MSDERVSRTYRSVASERTPAHLDKAVLAEAARAAEPRYSRLTRWTRPLAWAATAVLSVALVLELTRAPVPETVAPASVPETVAPAGEPETVAPAGEPETVAPAEMKAEPEAAAPSPEIAAPEAERRERVFEADAFSVSDDDMRQRAEDFVRLQEGTVSADAALGRSSSIATHAPPTCDDTETEDPETWLACIEELEETGFSDAAARQRELLAKQFPDFESH